MTLPPIPQSEIIRTAMKKMDSATREEFEPWRYETVESLKESGALESALQQIARWVEHDFEALVMRGIEVGTAGIDSENPLAQTGMNAIRGAIATGFQLGLMAAIRNTAEDAPASRKARKTIMPAGIKAQGIQ